VHTELVSVKPAKEEKKVPEEVHVPVYEPYPL